RRRHFSSRLGVHAAPLAESEQRARRSAGAVERGAPLGAGHLLVAIRLAAGEPGHHHRQSPRRAVHQDPIELEPELGEPGAHAALELLERRQNIGGRYLLGADLEQQLVAHPALLSFDPPPAARAESAAGAPAPRAAPLPLPAADASACAFRASHFSRSAGSLSIGKPSAARCSTYASAALRASLRTRAMYPTRSL